MAFLDQPDLPGPRALRRAGLLFGVFLVLRSVIHGCVHGEDTLKDLLWGSVFGGAGVLLLLVIGRLANAFLIGRRLRATMTGDNPAAALAGAGHHIAAATIIGRCIYGDDLTTLWISVVLLVVALATMLILLMLFRTLTSYDDDQEIAGGNVAAALSYAGASVALAIIVGHAADSAFVALGISLHSYLVALALCAALYPVRQLLVQRLILGLPLRWRGGRLDALIARDRNPAGAAAEALVYLATSLLVTSLV